MKKNTTKRSLLASLLALVMCVTMLVGTTFAWFTDSASTSVNKIEAGRLKVDIVDADNTDTSLKGGEMSFVNKDNSADILWEPGATFKTPAFKIKNAGNLALKYKLALNGVTGDNELLDVIKFSVVKADGTEVDLDSFEGNLTPAAPLSDALYIQGYMDKNASNHYQGMILEGIGITVYAAQDTVENDSNGNTYDERAEYPITVEELKATYGVDGLSMPDGVKIACPSGDGKVYVTLEDEEAFLYFTQVFDKAAARAARETALDNGAERYPGESVHNNFNIWHYENVYVKLECDVDLQNRVVKPFTAYNSFNGDGHTIKNATVVGDGSQYVGFFGVYSITNVKMDNIHVKADSNQWAGIVSGYNFNTISYVTVTNSTVTGGKYTGAIAGDCYANLENCVVENCVISGQYKVGGLAGYACCESTNGVLKINNNTVNNVEVKLENKIPNQSSYPVGKLVGHWNVNPENNGATAECKNNHVSNVTGGATADIARISNGSVTR